MLMKVGTLIEQFHSNAMKSKLYIYDVIRQNYAVKLSRLAFRTFCTYKQIFGLRRWGFRKKSQRKSVTNRNRTKMTFVLKSFHRFLREFALL